MDKLSDNLRTGKVSKYTSAVIQVFNGPLIHVLEHVMVTNAPFMHSRNEVLEQCSLLIGYVLEKDSDGLKRRMLLTYFT